MLICTALAAQADDNSALRRAKRAVVSATPHKHTQFVFDLRAVGTQTIGKQDDTLAEK